MSKNLKIIFSIIGLLAIGFLAGFQGHRMIMKKQFHKIAKERIGPNYGDRMMDLLEVSDQQRIQLKPIFEKYGTQLSDMKNQEHDKRKVVYENMKEELLVHLTETQVEKLSELKKRKRTKKSEKSNN